AGEGDDPFHVRRIGHGTRVAKGRPLAWGSRGLTARSLTRRLAGCCPAELRGARGCGVWRSGPAEAPVGVPLTGGSRGAAADGPLTAGAAGPPSLALSLAPSLQQLGPLRV